MEEARVGRRLSILSDCVHYSSCTLGLLLVTASVGTGFGALRQLQEWFTEKKDLEWDADARSVDAAFGWPCFALFGAVFILRRVLAERLNSDLVYRASWSVLTLQVVVLVLLCQDFLLDNGYIKVHTEWMFSLVLAAVLLVDGLVSTLSAILQKEELEDFEDVAESLFSDVAE